MKIIENYEKRKKMYFGYICIGFLNKRKKESLLKSAKTSLINSSCLPNFQQNKKSR